MKAPSFFEGVLFAVGASIGGSLVYGALLPFLSFSLASRVLISGLTLVYLLYSLARAPLRQGRFTILAAWFFATGLLWLWWPLLSDYLLAQLAAIWLVRSLYFQSGFWGACADFVLHGMALGAAFVAFDHSGSLFLSLWSFFLVHALFSGIPALLTWTAPSRTAAPESDRFRHAYRSAESALRRLSSPL